MHPTDPLYASQWHLTRLGNIEKIWDDYTGAGVHVGIYDSGVETTHPDLAAGYDASLQFVYGGVTESGGVDFPNQPDPASSGHGTPIAGIIAARADNAIGGVGVAFGSTFTSVNIDEYLIRNPVGGADKLIASLEHQASFDVTNNSWNRSGPQYLASDNMAWDDTFVTREIAAFELASDTGRNGLGTVIVQGVGNDNAETQGNGLNTARFTITVGGVGPDGFAASYSGYGASLLVTAPTRAGGSDGGGILTTDLTGTAGYNLAADHAASSDYTDRFGGTSASAPIVTGIATLMLQANPGLGWRDVQNILAASATHTGSAIGAGTPGTNENSKWFLNDASDWNGGGMHFSNDYGYGMVNAYNAVRMAEVWSLFQTAQTSANERSWSNWNWGGDIADTGVAIPDHAALNDSLLLTTTPYGMRVEHVEVTIDFEHQDFTDLRIFLISAQGTEVQIFDGTGGATAATADDGLKWTFGVDALRGELASGEWRLRIEDIETGNAGHLNWFEVKVFGQETSNVPATRNDTYHYTDEFLAMAALAGQSSRTTLNDAGGTDWIDAAAVTGDFALNLGAGMASTVDGVTWFTIANGVTIENAVTGDGNDTIIGNGAANMLLGMRGNDTLDGGAGSDILKGGTGNDTYALGAEATGLDTVVELAGQGTADLITSTISRSLAAYAQIENLTLLNVATALAGTGNDLANTITGNNFNNMLIGGANTDTMIGGAGNDLLDGGIGADHMLGGIGNDTYVVDHAGDIVNETGGNGIDIVKSSISFSLANVSRVFGLVENLILLNIATALTGSGNALANIITGNNFNNMLIGGANTDTLSGGAGNDLLDGGIGVDHMLGGIGNDTYVVDHAGDIVNETGGNGVDLIRSSINFSLANTSRVLGLLENLTLLNIATALTGSGNGLANVITGNNFSNTLSGGAGNDLLDGGIGVDRMLGGIGNDTYVVDHAGDIVNETGGNGVDMVKSSISFSLANASRVLGLVEYLTLTGTAANGTGNALANVLIGNGYNNILSGSGGNDVLSAGGGNDVLSGGLGNDTLVGGTGKDIFVFNTLLNTSTNRDAIADFNPVDDTFQLDNAIFVKLGAAGALNPGFFFAGAAAHDANDYIVYNRASGALFYDSNGSAPGGAIQFATLSNHPVLAANDFIVI